MHWSLLPLLSASSGETLLRAAVEPSELELSRLSGLVFPPPCLLKDRKQSKLKTLGVWRADAVIYWLEAILPTERLLLWVRTAVLEVSVILSMPLRI